MAVKMDFSFVSARDRLRNIVSDYRDDVSEAMSRDHKSVFFNVGGMTFRNDMAFAQSPCLDCDEHSEQT